MKKVVKYGTVWGVFMETKIEKGDGGRGKRQRKKETEYKMKIRGESETMDKEGVN